MWWIIGAILLIIVFVLCARGIKRLNSEKSNEDIIEWNDIKTPPIGSCRIKGKYEEYEITFNTKNGDTIIFNVKDGQIYKCNISSPSENRSKEYEVG